MRTYCCKKNVDQFLAEVREIIVTGELGTASINTDTVEAYNGKRVVVGNTVTQERTIYGASGTSERYIVEAKSVYEYNKVILSLKSFNNNTLRYVELDTRKYDNWNPVPMHRLFRTYEDRSQQLEACKEAVEQSLEIVNRLDTILSTVRGVTVDKHFLTCLDDHRSDCVAANKDTYGVRTSRVLGSGNKTLRIDVSLGFDHGKEILDIRVKESE